MGYVSSDSIGSEGGIGRAAGYMSMIAEGIKDKFFTLNKNEIKTIGKIENRLSQLRLRYLSVEDYMGNLVGVEELREDSSNKLIVRLNKGYMFKAVGKRGLPIVGCREIVTENNYYRGFGYPTVYDIDSRDKLIALCKKRDKIVTRGISGVLASLGAIPMAIGSAAFNINNEIALPILLGYIALTSGYIGKQLYEGFQLFDKKSGIKPKFIGDEALEKLCKLYEVD